MEKSTIDRLHFDRNAFEVRVRVLLSKRVVLVVHLTCQSLSVRVQIFLSIVSDRHCDVADEVRLVGGVVSDELAH